MISFGGGVLSLVLSSFLASFLHMEVVDETGKLLIDNTFNVDQFIRSNFYILSVISIVGMLYLIFGMEWKLKYRNVLLVITGVWCMLALAAFVANGKWNLHEKEDAWYHEIYTDLRSGKYYDGLIAVNPALHYYGIMLSSSDYGQYWSAMDQSSGNYNSTFQNKYRWQMFKLAIDSMRGADLVKMKKDGVKYIISTPLDSAKLAKVSAAYPQYLQRMTASNWAYELK